MPGALALLPEYAGQQDPLAELRAACRAAVAWLCEPGETVAVQCEHQSLRLAEHLVGEAGGTLHPIDDRPAPTLVIGNGSARRTEKAPGHLDPRAASFDAALGRALTSPDPAALARLDGTLAQELWADVETLRWLGAEVLTGSERVMVDYDDDPYGGSTGCCGGSATRASAGDGCAGTVDRVVAHRHACGPPSQVEPATGTAGSTSSMPVAGGRRGAGLFEWRQREGVGWEGWVIAADPPQGGATEATVRQSWVPASSIRPVDV
ncbi:hypothetical protein [Nocardioides aquaticus]|uniref:hypothetical protein n=1 Tax=Nocardioides aquaticus TaxID=160826 RepID=UPI0031DF234E